MPTFNTLDAKLLNDSISTVNDNLTVHHKETAATLQQISKHIGEHQKDIYDTFEQIVKKLDTIIDRIYPPMTITCDPAWERAVEDSFKQFKEKYKRQTPEQDLVLEIKRVADSIPEETKEALRNGSWQTLQISPTQDSCETAELVKHLAEHGNKPFVSKPCQFNIHHQDTPSSQESNGVQGEPCQSDQVSELKRTIERLVRENELVVKSYRNQLQEKDKEVQRLQRTANHLAEKEALARQQLLNKSQELENLHQAYNKEVQKLSETLNELSQVNIRNQVLSNEKETLKHEKEELNKKMNSMFVEYQQQRTWAENEIRQLKDTIVKMQMEKHSSIVSVVSGRSPQSNGDQTSK